MLKIATYKIDQKGCTKFHKKEKKMGINLGMIERKKEHPVSALDTRLCSLGFVVVRCSSQALSRRGERKGRSSTWAGRRYEILKISAEVLMSVRSDLSFS